MEIEIERRIKLNHNLILHVHVLGNSLALCMHLMPTLKAMISHIQYRPFSQIQTTYYRYFLDQTASKFNSISTKMNDQISDVEVYMVFIV